MRHHNRLGRVLSGGSAFPSSSCGLSLYLSLFLYWQGFLVASTLTGKLLEDIGTFLKWNQILEMSHRRRLSSLIIWREVFVAGCNGNRSFVALVGSVFILYNRRAQRLEFCIHYVRNNTQGHTLLVAFLECGGVVQT